MKAAWIVTWTSIGTMLVDWIVWSFVIGRPIWRPKEGDVIAFVVNRHPYPVPSYVLQTTFGSAVYPVARELADRGFLVRDERPSTVPARKGTLEEVYRLGHRLKQPSEFEGALSTLQDEESDE